MTGVADQGAGIRGGARISDRGESAIVRKGKGVQKVDFFFFFFFLEYFETTPRETRDI